MIVSMVLRNIIHSEASLRWTKPVIYHFRFSIPICADILYCCYHHHIFSLNFNPFCVTSYIDIFLWRNSYSLLNKPHWRGRIKIFPFFVWVIYFRCEFGCLGIYYILPYLIIYLWVNILQIYNVLFNNVFSLTVFFSSN